MHGDDNYFSEIPDIIALDLMFVDTTRTGL